MMKFYSLCLLLFITLHSGASASNVINIITFGESSIKEQYVQRLKSVLLSRFNEIDIEKDKITKTEGIYIAIGSKALIQLLELKLQRPILTVFVKKSSFYHIIKGFEHQSLAQGQLVNLNHIGAIYSDPPIEKQIQLISEIFGAKASFGVVTSPITEFMQTEITHLANANNLSVEFVNYRSNDNINKIINSLKNQNVIFAIPDNLVWNSTTLKNIVLSTYRNEQPIVGFSRNLVKAGSIASSYSDLGDVVKETIDRVKLMDMTNPVTIRASAKYNSLVTNDNVLRSLNLKQPQK